MCWMAGTASDITPKWDETRDQPLGPGALENLISNVLQIWFDYYYEATELRLELGSFVCWWGIRPSSVGKTEINYQRWK